MDAVSATIVAGGRARIRLNNLVNLFNHFDGGIVTNMRKASHPSGGMG
jgi:hypothetical protein